MTNTSYNFLYINVNIINIFIWTSFVKKKSCQSVSSKQDSANIIICSSICKVWLWNEKNISGQTRNILMMPEMEVTVRATPFTQNSICSVRSFRSSRSAVVQILIKMKILRKFTWIYQIIHSSRRCKALKLQTGWTWSGHSCNAAYCVHRNLNFQFNFSQPEIKKAANNFFLRQINIYLIWCDLLSLYPTKFIQMYLHLTPHYSFVASVLNFDFVASFKGYNHQPWFSS